VGFKDEHENNFLTSDQSVDELFTVFDDVKKSEFF